MRHLLNQRLLPINDSHLLPESTQEYFHQKAKTKSANKGNGCIVSRLIITIR